MSSAGLPSFNFLRTRCDVKGGKSSLSLLGSVKVGMTSAFSPDAKAHLYDTRTFLRIKLPVGWVDGWEFFHRLIKVGIGPDGWKLVLMMI